MSTGKETFQKGERLCSIKVISGLFDEGNIFYTSLLKIAWNKSAQKMEFPARVSFSVSKKGFRNAVTRNLIKRRLREAYRKNKSLLYNYLDSEGLQVVFIIIFRGPFVPDYQTAEKAVRDMLVKFTGIIAASEKNC